jgi:serine/threonine-protein kinase
MSPEQLAKKRLDARSDIFSFGLTMFEFVTGRHPCSGDTKEIMRQIRSPRHKWPAPSSINEDLPPRVDRVVLKALRRESERRYQSMSEMILDLNRASKSRI